MKYVEREAAEDDRTGEVIDAIAGGPLWVLVSARMIASENPGVPDLQLRVDLGGMVPSTGAARALLVRALNALPED